MNEFEQFKKNMEEKHKEMLADFGIPDKLITSEDVNLWRFVGRLVPNVEREERFGWAEVVPVLAQGGRQIGAATIYPKGGHLFASVSVTKDIPERLDYENGTDFVLTADYQQMECFAGADDTYQIASIGLMPYDPDMDTPADAISDVWEDV